MAKPYSNRTFNEKLGQGTAMRSMQPEFAFKLLKAMIPKQVPFKERLKMKLKTLEELKIS